MAGFGLYACAQRRTDSCDCPTATVSYTIGGAKGVSKNNATLKASPALRAGMDPAVLRDDMVDSLQHETKGHLAHTDLIEAMRGVPRHQFVDGDSAYEDVSHRYRGSTVLSPSMVAILFEALEVRPTDSVLIVGAGVGYTAAVAAELTDSTRVQAVDIDRNLVLAARSNLARAGYREVLVDCRDGTNGLQEYAPYDRILLEAAAVAPPRQLKAQLADDGRLVMPLGTKPQEIVAIENDRIIEHGPSVRFKPLLVEGEQGAALERNRMHREEAERTRQSSKTRPGWEQEWIKW